MFTVNGVLVGLSATTRHGNRPGERKARALLEVLRDRQPDVLRFTHDLKVPPTSNQAQRDLRPAKVQQNISGRLTSEQRTQDRYRIRGYLSTAAKHGHNMIDALRQAILGQPWMPPDPAPT
jgi:transposase